MTPMLIVGTQMSMDDSIRQHIQAIAARDDVLPLLGYVGGGDRTQPAAREWVRLWGPNRLAATLPECSCAAGRCAICN